MKPVFMRLLALVSLFGMTTSGLLAGDDFAGLSEIAVELAKQVQAAGGKTIAVVDFVDLEGRTSELGRALAEEMTTLLVRNGKPLRVIDRTSLRAILQELRLTEEGLVKRENSRRLAEISGVDVLCTGTLGVVGDRIRVNIKALDTATGTIVAASSLSLERTESADRMLRFEAGSTLSPQKPDVGEYQGQRMTQRLQYLEVSLTSFEILQGGELRATLQFTNVSRTGDGLALCLKAEHSDGIADFWKFFPTATGSVTDEAGNKYRLVEQSGLGFCRTKEDWLILKAGGEARGALSFKSDSRSVPGSVFSLTADLRLVTKVGANQQVSSSALSFSSIRPRGK